MKRILPGFIFLLLLIGEPVSPGQPACTPVVRGYSFKEYRGADIVWSITSYRNGTLYFANNDYGILRYDGTIWERIPVGGGRYVRMVHRAPSGRIYAGGNGYFGYLKKQNGRERFVTLSEKKVADSRFEVFQILSLGSTVYFRSFDRLFMYSEKTKALRVLKSEHGFARIIREGNNLYSYKGKKGLFRITGGRETLVPFSIRNRRRLLYPVLLPLPGRMGSLLVSSRGLFLADLEKRSISPLDSPLHRLLRKRRFYTAVRIDRDRIAVGFLSSGIIISDNRGKIISRIDRRSGLFSDRVYFLYVDGQGVLWAALRLGLASIHLSSPFCEFGVSSGLRGVVKRVRIFGGRLYVCTEDGAYEFAGGQFRRIHDKFCSDICIYKGKMYFFGGRNSYIRTGNIVRKSYKYFIVEKCLLLPGGKGLCLLKTSKGVRLARLHETGFRSLSVLDGNTGSGESLLAGKNGTWWASVGRGKIYHFKVDTVSGSFQLIRKYSVRDGLPRGLLSLYSIRNELYAVMDRSIFRHDPGKRRFVTDTRFLPYTGAAGIKAIVADKNGTVYIQNKNDTILIVLRPDGTVYPNHLASRFESRITFLGTGNDGCVWIGGQNHLIRMDTATVTTSSPAGMAVAGVRIDGKRVRSGTRVVVPAGTDLLEVHFVLKGFEHRFGNVYRFRLRGFLDSWQPWQRETMARFRNLPSGSYLFEVEGRSVTGLPGRIASVEIVVPPRWYASAWAVVLYILIGLAGVSLFFRIRLRQVRRKTLAEMRVRQRLLEAKLHKYEALLSKMNAHFLFNALSSLNSLIGRDPVRAEEMLEHLSFFLRSIVLFDPAQMVPLERELEIAEAYLEIEKVRFGQRLAWEVRMENAPSGLTLPQLTLQPLVENSVKYGISPSVDGGKIILSVEETETGSVKIVVEDEVYSPDTGTPNGKGSGTAMANISERLQLAFSGRATLSGGPRADGIPGYRAEIGIEKGEREDDDTDIAG